MLRPDTADHSMFGKHMCLCQQRSLKMADSWNTVFFNSCLAFTQIEELSQKLKIFPNRCYLSSKYKYLKISGWTQRQQ